MIRALPTSPPQYRGVFTTASARACGWSPAALLHAANSGRVTRLTRGVYVASELLAEDGPEGERRRMTIHAVAATLAVSGVASHTSAALLDELPVWTLADQACVTVAPRFTGDSRCAHLHRASTLSEHLTPDLAVRRTCAARTVLDTAREHGIEDGVVMGDYALRYGLLTERELCRIADYCGRWPGIRRARHVLELLEPRSESPLESVSRLRMAGTRLPRPEPQVRIYDVSGRFLGRLDFYFDDFGVAGEVDGKVKYALDPREAAWREKRRQGPMEDTGLLFVRWGRADIEDMAMLTRRIETVLARGARRPRSDRAWIARPTARESVIGLPRESR